MLNVDYVKILNWTNVDINVPVSASVVCAVVCVWSLLSGSVLPSSGRPLENNSRIRRAGILAEYKYENQNKKEIWN